MLRDYGRQCLANTIRRRSLLRATCALVLMPCMASAADLTTEQSLSNALRDLEALLRWPQKTKELVARYRTHATEPNRLLTQLRASSSKPTSALVVEHFLRMRANDFEHDH